LAALSDIRLLTGHDLVVDAEPATSIQGARPRALFAALLLNANEDVSRDWLAFQLWPDVPQQLARQRLRMTLLNLKNALQDLAEIQIDAKPETLRLNLERRHVDMFRFEDAISGTARAEDFIDLYKGDLLGHFPAISDEFDNVLSEKRNSLRALYLTAAERELQRAHASGDAVIFQRVFNDIIRVDPTNERAVELALAFWSSFQRPDLVETVFRDHEARLKEHLSVEPSDIIVEAWKTSRSPQPGSTPQSVARPAIARERVATIRNKPPGVKGSGTRRVAAALAIIAAAIAGWFAWPSLFGATGPVFIVMRPDIAQQNCTSPTSPEDYRLAIVDALDAVENATIVIGDVRGLFVRAKSDVYAVNIRIECLEEQFRATTLLTDKETHAVIFSARHMSVPEDFEPLTTAIETTIGLRGG
jgi:DNA-binding SARP family transcriptional activator